MPLLRRKSKYPPVSSIPLEERWALAEVHERGRSMYLRINVALEPLAGHPEYADLLLVAVSFHAADERGLPDLAELERVGEIEDALVAALTGDGRTLPAAIVTSDGMRKFAFYTREPATVGTLVDELAGRFPEHELQHGCVRDPDWQSYRTFRRTLPS